MAENITSLELNGIKYALGKSIYAELDLSLERFVELLGRDFYCPTLNSAPTSTTKTYQDTDESVNTFQIGQPCRWMESDGTYRLAVLADMTSSSATWYKLPVKVSELTNDAGYLTSHQDISHLATKTELSKKQDTISDLSAIRANAEKGATALQSVPSEYVTETELSSKGYATTSALNSGLSGKVDKDGSKVLSSNDFTNALKSKLEGLSNYDDSEISNAINKLRTDFDTIVSGDTTTAIKTFNEVIAFLDGITDTQDLESIIASIEQQIAAKLDKTTAASTYLSKTDAASTYLGKTAKAASATTADSATKATQDASGNVITTTYATKDELNNVSVTSPKFKNVQASTWVSDSTYSDFPYKCVLTCSGVTANDYAEVVFDVEQASSGSYAPVCETGANTVTIWSSINTAITIPAIIITK